MRKPTGHTCLLCRGSDLSIIPEYTDLSRVTSDVKPFKKGGVLQFCKQCFTVQKVVDPKFLGECDEIYGQYTLHSVSSIGSQVVFHDEQAIDRSIVIANHLAPYLKHNLLDIGSGNGSFLRAVGRIYKELGLYAYDINLKNEHIFHEIPNFRQFYSGELESIHTKFDLISLQHVLEHITNPLEFLDDLKRLMNPEGVLFIQVPNNQKNPFDILVADHVTHFHLEILLYLMELSGYEVVECSESWVLKEISLVVRPCSSKTLPNHTIKKASNVGYDDIKNRISYLKAIVKQANACSTHTPFGIFGSAISSTWLYGALESPSQVSFFLDEDPSKWGNKHLGIPVLRPTQTPKGATVYVPLITENINSILKRGDVENWGVKLVYTKVEEFEKGHFNGTF